MVPVRPVKAADKPKSLNIKHHDIIEFGRIPHYPNIYLTTSTYTWCRTSLPLPFTSMYPSGKHCNSNRESSHLLLPFDRDKFIGTEKTNHDKSCLVLYDFAFRSQSRAHVLPSRHETCPPHWHQANRVKQPVPRKRLWKHGQPIETVSEIFHFVPFSCKVEAMTICHGPSDTYRGKKQTNVGKTYRYCSFVPTMCNDLLLWLEQR